MGAIETAATREGLETYVIRGGKEGAARLNVLARALAPSTTALLDQLGSLEGFTIVDAACGSGDVTMELAKRVGPKGRVIGLDLDREKLEVASERARGMGLGNCAFTCQDITAPWPVEKADVVYARFILTHLRRPEELLLRARDVLKSGGLMVTEDIDAGGMFCEPDSVTMDKLRALYIAVTRLKGCDPFVGKRLGTLLAKTGFAAARTRLVQPYGADTPAKDAVVMTYHAVSQSIIAAKLASEREMEWLLAELDTYAESAGSIVAMPRIFQAWGVKK